VRISNEWNFSGTLIERLTENSCLIDAPDGQTLSGPDISGLIVGFAAGYLSSGITPGERILIVCGLTPASTLAYLGAMYAGIIPVLVDERALAISGAATFSKAGAKAFWTAQDAPWAWAAENHVQHIHGTYQPCSPSQLPPAACGENDLAALMPTSGSSGVPRLVKVSHCNLRTNTEAILRSQKLDVGERAMLIMPVSYCFGASVVHTHLYQGGGVVFDSRFMFPDKVLRAIDAFRCTTLAGVPAVYNILLRRSNLRSLALPSLRRFIQAGGSLNPESIREMCRISPAADFFVMYGQTEATARISSFSATDSPRKIGSAGLPLDNLKVRIVGEDGRELPNDCTGEIQVQGPSVCSGYFDDAESTVRKFNGGWLKTGDFGSLDQDGYIWIKGRTDEFIKIRGVRVSVGEVEAHVAALPGVFECAAVGVEHPEAGEALALFVVSDCAAADELIDNGLAEKVRRALPAQWTCAFIKLVPDLPRTENGKIARSRLRTLV